MCLAERASKTMMRMFGRSGAVSSGAKPRADVPPVAAVDLRRRRVGVGEGAQPGDRQGEAQFEKVTA